MIPLVMAPGMFTEVFDDVLYMLVRVPRDGRCLAYVLLLGRTFTAEQQTAWKAQARNESGVPACLTRYEWEREQAFALADELDLLSVGSKHTELVKAVIEIFVAVQSRCRPYLLEVSGASMEEARAEVIDCCWKNFARTGVIFHMQPANICGGSKPCWR